jgi:hypothetical protein
VDKKETNECTRLKYLVMKNIDLALWLNDQLPKDSVRRLSSNQRISLEEIKDGTEIGDCP